MKTNNELHSVAFTSVALVLLLIIVSSTASAATAQSTPIKITETQITTNLSNSYSPAIYGNTIVWQDDRNGNWDIYIQVFPQNNKLTLQI
jgi:beta propeller repeat protein